ncbi:MAG: WD40/YVTN/BNR-like repeat-containing protein [Candidatus Zhuqueibacterota bacterium]
MTNYQRSIIRFIGIILFSVMSTVSFGGGKKIKPVDAEQRLSRYARHEALKETSLFKHLPWQFLGPTNISGRMTDVAVVAPKGKNYTIYVAGASGGVWKSMNEGTTWTPIFEHAPSTSIGDVTLAPSDPNIIWVGTGEANIFRSSMAGSGVYKSVDAGKTWQYMGLAKTHTIPRIVIHPENPDIVYVAASGHEWTNNEDRGVYRSRDGGASWEKILYINDKTGVIDLVMNPADPNIMYAAAWQRIRLKWNDPRNEPNYTGSGIFKTTDGGDTWKPINAGLPEAKFRGRIGLDLCAAKPGVVYSFVDNYEQAGQAEEGETDSYGRPRGGMIRGATVFRSDDGGENWRQVSEPSDYMLRLSATYGWVFGQIRVDPVDENKIYAMGISLHVSEDGGKTFRRLRGMHADHHGLWIDPENTRYLVNANDGGLAISYDGGENWRTFYDNIPMVQFFNVMVDMAEPFHVYGSIQDHGSRRGIVDLSQGRDAIPAVAFEYAPGGEGSSHAIDPTDPNIVYSAGFYGSITRTDLNTGQEKDIMPRPGKDAPKYRGQWLAPFIISPHNPLIIYHGMNYLFRSLNRGETWQKISPDLTGNDPEKRGDISFQTLSAISESPLRFGLIYAGTDDGRAHVTRDGGLSWKEISKSLPQRWISRIVASAFDEATVYLSQNGKRDDDFAAYLWKSNDYGDTWQDISGNIPCGPINVVREDPHYKNILYVGTDLGAYVSIDGGGTWNILAKNFPTTFVHDLVIHPRDRIAVAATHGRGMYAMDVSYLAQLTETNLAQHGFLYDVESVKLPSRRRGWGDDQLTVRIAYFLKMAEQVKLCVADSAGNAIRELQTTGDAGLNFAQWDLRPEKQAAEGKDSLVQAGRYKIQLSLESGKIEKEFEVLK